MPRSAIEWIDSESSDAEPVQIQPANLMPATPELPTIAAKTARDPTLMWPTGVRAGSEKAPIRRARSCVGVRPLAAGRAAAASAPAAASSPFACRARHAEGRDTASSYAACPAWLGCNSASSRLHLGCTSATPRLHLGSSRLHLGVSSRRLVAATRGVSRRASRRCGRAGCTRTRPGRGAGRGRTRPRCSRATKCRSRSRTGG